MFWLVIGTSIGIGCIVHGYRGYRWLQNERRKRELLEIFAPPRPSDGV